MRQLALLAALFCACQSANPEPVIEDPASPLIDIRDVRDQAIEAPDTSNEATQLIRALADAEQPDPTATRPAKASELPKRVIDSANVELAERGALNDASGHDVGGASFDAAAPFRAIISAGETIGYVVSISDFVDHPQWTGSGVHLYYDTTGNVIAATEWSG